MLVSLQWLNEYVRIQDYDIEVLRKKMSAAGLSVERQHVVGEGIEHIVIGEIIEKVAHENSDHLWVTKVVFGSQDDNLSVVQIVTGAQNIEVGQKVPVILSGYKLPNGMAIETTKLRGVESQGMMCSSQELGIGDDHSGILILDSDAPVGASFSEYYGFPDVVFDVEITPNRGDLLSMYGIAREVSVLIDRPLLAPERKLLALSPKNKDENDFSSITITIDDSNDCDRLSAVGLKGDFLQPTPFFIRQRLLRAGMRPLSLLVDISNYVMLELGQPNHAYDAEKIAQHNLRVRRGGFGEQLVLLDGSSIELDPTMLVIADGHKAVGLAGIMGGEHTKIDSNTQTIIVEAAHFDPVVIRKTTMKTNLRSEASMRFERKVDPTLTDCSLERFYALVSKITAVEVIMPLADVDYYEKHAPRVALRSSLLTTYMGKDLSLTYVERTLTALGFEVDDASHAGDHGGWHISVKVPTWRWADVSIEEDLIEEIARIFGYDSILVGTPKGRIPSVLDSKNIRVKRGIIEGLVSQGWWELLTYSFNNESQIELCGYTVDKAIKVHNPLSKDHEYMRLSLLPNLLQIAHKNMTQYKNLKLFEVSRAYHQKLYSVLPEELVDETFEREYLSGVVAIENGLEDAFSDLKNLISYIEQSLNIKGLKIVQNNLLIEQHAIKELFHPGRVAGVFIQEQFVGLFGQINPRAEASLGLNKSVCLFELSLDPLVQNSSLVGSYEPFSIYPKTRESLSFVVDDRINIGEIVEVARMSHELVVNVDVENVYRGEKVEKGQKVVTLVINYQKADGPVQNSEAEEIRKQIITSLDESFKAALKSN